MAVATARHTQAGTLRTESPLRDLAAIIRSRTPLIAVESNEEPQIVSMVRQIGHQLQLKAYRWTVTEGMQAFDPNDQPQESVLKSQEILNYIKTASSNCLYVLLDFHPYLQDNVHVRFLKDIALGYGRHYSTVVLVGTTLEIPKELRPFTAYFRLPLPTPEQLRQIVYDVAGEWGAQHHRQEVQTTNKALDLLVRKLTGLTATDARRCEMPSAQNRKDIFGIHLRKRCLDPAVFNLESLSAAADGFSGAEIEQAIVSAMYTAHAHGQEVSQADLLAEIRQTKPLSVLMAEQVQELRDWAAERTVPCD